MKNPFKMQGFDTVISTGVAISGEMTLNGTCVIEGTFNGTSIKSNNESDTKTKNFLVVNAKNVLVVNGDVDVKEIVMSDDLTVTGTVTASIIRVEGTLAIKSGSILRANTVYYRNLMAEPGAVIIGEMRHLDHSSDPLEI